MGSFLSMFSVEAAEEQGGVWGSFFQRRIFGLHFVYYYHTREYSNILYK